MASQLKYKAPNDEDIILIDIKHTVLRMNNCKIIAQQKITEMIVQYSENAIGKVGEKLNNSIKNKENNEIIRQNQSQNNLLYRPLSRFIAICFQTLNENQNNLMQIQIRLHIIIRILLLR